MRTKHTWEVLESYTASNGIVWEVRRNEEYSVKVTRDGKTWRTFTGQNGRSANAKHYLETCKRLDSEGLLF